MAIAVVARTGPSVRLSAKDDATGSNARVVTNPGCVDGELLIAIQSQTAGTSAAMTAPSTVGWAWTQRGVTGGSASVGFMKIWYRVASNETSTWSFGGDGDGNVVVLVIPNWDTRGDAYLWDVEPTFNTGTADATQDSPSVTMARSTNRLIRAWASESGGAGHDTVVAYTEHQDSSVAAGNSLSVQSQETVGAGTTGIVTANVTGGGVQDYVAVAFALSSPPNHAEDNYTPSLTCPHWSTADNTLIALIGANSTGADAATACRISSVVDDAHNTWIEGPTVFATASGDPNTSVRMAIWYCPGARAIRQLTVTATEICDALGVQILEASGITNVSVLDISASNQSASAAGATASGTTANANDLIVAGAVVGDSDITFNHTADTWTVLDNVDTASTLEAVDDIKLRSAYKILSSAGAQSTAWTLSPSGAVAWALIALKGGTVSTTNPNPNWPQVVHEVAFGVPPNDPTATQSWTAVTERVTAFATQRGRDYELARTEAGEADIRMRNHDGALDPQNTSSPYYPDVKVITPYRVRATWDGQVYPIFTGYVERWPQKWENHLGSSRMQVVDGLATLSGTRLAGTLGAEILADEPHAYWPLDDGRLASQAANKATTTTVPLTATESVNKGGQGSFGATLVLQSEESTCWQQTRSTQDTSDAPGAIYGYCLVGGLDLPQLSGGVLVECWAKIPPSTPQQSYTIFALKASAFTSESQRRVMVLRTDSVSGLPVVDTVDSSGSVTARSASVSGLNDDSWHHYVVHMTSTEINLWIDGTNRLTASLPSVPASTIDRLYIGGQVDEWSNEGIAVGSFAHVAVFEIASPDSRRVAARANAGLFGFPERSGARMSRLLNYAGWTAGRAIDEGLAFLGAAATIARQTLLAAVQDVSSWENGLVFVDSNGNFRFVDRANRFNQNTKWIFGDGDGEIPYETDVEIDFDPKYVYNDVTITKSAGRTLTGETVAGGSSAHKKDQGSIASYFTRTLDKTSGVSSISQCEAEATWTLENYAQPRPRLARISIKPSANPDLWPVALGTEIGDRVTVKRRPFGGVEIDLDCYVEQVGHQVKPGEWRTVFSLSPVLLTTYGAQNEWILDASALDVDTIVGD